MSSPAGVDIIASNPRLRIGVDQPSVRVYYSAPQSITLAPVLPNRRRHPVLPLVVAGIVVALLTIVSEILR